MSEPSPFPLVGLAAVADARNRKLPGRRAPQRCLQLLLSAQERVFMAGISVLLELLLHLPVSDIVEQRSAGRDMAMALRERSGPLGKLLALVDSEHVAEVALSRVRIAPESDWRSLPRAYHWAVQVSRNLS